MAKNIDVYRATGKLVEKYDVTHSTAAGGGEYPLQDGFGWTNGVLRKLIAMYPQEASIYARYDIEAHWHEGGMSERNVHRELLKNIVRTNFNVQIHINDGCGKEC